MKRSAELRQTLGEAVPSWPPGAERGSDTPGHDHLLDAYSRAVVGAVNEATSWFLEKSTPGNPQELAEQLCRAFGV